MNKQNINIGIQLAFYYGEQVVNWCRDNRICETKKLSRAYKQIKKNFENSLNSHQLELINRLLNEIVNDQLFKVQTYCTLSNALNSVYESHEYLDVIINCMLSMMLCDILFCENINAQQQKIIDALKAIMDAYIPGTLNITEFREHYKNQIDLIKKSYSLRLNKIEY